MELAAETGEEEEEEDSLRGRVTRGRSGPAKKKIDFLQKRHVGVGGVIVFFATVILISQERKAFIERNINICASVQFRCASWRHFESICPSLM